METATEHSGPNMEELYAYGAKKGWSRERIDLLMCTLLTPVETRSRLTWEKIFPIIACEESAVKRHALLVELAETMVFRLRDVLADFDTWQRKGGRPAC